MIKSTIGNQSPLSNDKCENFTSRLDQEVHRWLGARRVYHQLAEQRSGTLDRTER